MKTLLFIIFLSCSIPAVAQRDSTSYARNICRTLHFIKPDNYSQMLVDWDSDSSAIESYLFSSGFTKRGDGAMADDRATNSFTMAYTGQKRVLKNLTHIITSPVGDFKDIPEYWESQLSLLKSSMNEPKLSIRPADGSYEATTQYIFEETCDDLPTTVTTFLATNSNGSRIITKYEKRRRLDIETINAAFGKFYILPLGADSVVATSLLLDIPKDKRGRVNTKGGILSIAGLRYYGLVDAEFNAKYGIYRISQYPVGSIEAGFESAIPTFEETIKNIERIFLKKPKIKGDIYSWENITAKGQRYVIQVERTPDSYFVEQYLVSAKKEYGFE